MKLSVYLITKNEGKRLERTLKAVSQVADEIIVVDSGSEDNTKEIALKYKAHFIFNPWKSYADQKFFAQSLCSYDWCLSVDADEVLSKNLIQEIKNLKKQDPPFKIYRLYIADMFPGFKKPISGTKKYNVERLYNKRYATMPSDALTEDRLNFQKTTPVGQLKNDVLHYSYLGISHHIKKLNWYTDEVQFTVAKKNKSYSYLRLATEFPRQFLIYYIKKRYFLNGFWGFSYAMNLAFARYLKIAKAIESSKLKKLSKDNTKEFL